jgi:hypothetical protein
MLQRITRGRTRMKALILAFAIGTSALSFAQDWRYNDHDRDDYRYDRDYDRDGDRHDRDYDRDGMHVARHFGFQDGASAGREDWYKRKPLNPYPRGKYAHEDRGYHREYGDKYWYQAEYARAYREGYERAYR